MSARKTDSHNRFRSKTVSFRLSPEENKQLDIIISLCGMTKRDYIASKLFDRKIYVQGSCKIHRAVYDKLNDILTELKRIDNNSQIDDELNDNITLISDFIKQLYEQNNH